MTTYIELKQKAEDLMRQAEAARKAEIGAALADIKAKMKVYGITLEDLGGKPSATRGRRPGSGKSIKADKGIKKAEKAKAPKTRKPVAAKYRNTETGETWTGRGKPPKWLAALEASGRKREEFVVSSA